MHEYLFDLLKILLPAALVLVGMYLVIKSYLDKETQRRVLELRMKNTEIVLPIRLQAYERICLLLERIAPSNLLIRVSPAGQNAVEFQYTLLAEIRNEFSHNVSQQVYMSEVAWQHVKQAKEDVVTMVNKAFHELPENAKGTDLAKRILESVIADNYDPTTATLSFIKQEINQVF
ncbi:hypothetical protein AHMF7605_00370 [Adhaeribacter arboris]|uniref:Uncharacterized protein n=1 Tax=Adhaeribacter arboris TaxID=2072846 RepID=A0A2T2Y987_9BACT|nr:hypothetical protein [Adhaeribacter arboris]PSR52080.1 hypothetical protein AHMF7605_00370 [Adhaeribacter arboris]